MSDDRTRPADEGIDAGRDELITLTTGTSVPARMYVPSTTPEAWIVIAPGAGAGRTHVFMCETAQALKERGCAIVTFDFPYRAAGRRMPDRMPVLEAAYTDVIRWTCAHAGSHTRVVIGGKSMGGRVASHLAARAHELPASVVGLLCIGYPLQPPGRPAQRRDTHLPAIALPSLFVQGERDAFGGAQELQPVIERMPNAKLHIVPLADHGLSVRRRSSIAQSTARADAWDAVAEWVRHIPARS